MPGRGLIIAGGIIAIIRGALQTIASAVIITTVGLEYVGGATVGLIWFELIMGLVLIVGGIYVLVKSSKPQAAGTIRIFGIAVAVLGLIDMIWAMTIPGAGLSAPAIGSVAACILIAGLLVAGAQKLATYVPPIQPPYPYGAQPQQPYPYGGQQPPQQPYPYGGQQPPQQQQFPPQQ